MIYRGVVELKSEEPELELSGLVGRILAIRLEDRTVGQAWSFHLRTFDGRRGLACKVEIEQENLPAGEIHLFVGDHQVLWHQTN